MSEFRIVQDKFEWKKILEDNDFRDIYYQYEYAYSLFLHGDGEPLLIYYKGLETELFYVVMQHDIADDDHFKDLIMKGRYYDWETPYGYGGPVIKGNFTLEDSQSFCRQLKEYCCDKKIVSQFVRFYPLLHNWEQKDLFDEIREIKRTVFIDTSTAEKIFENMDSKNRNMVRKAKRNNIIIEYDNGERLDEFIRIYTLTMNRHSADSYYIFSPDYYRYLIQNLSGQVKFFYAIYEGEIISASIFFYNDKYMHYHLSGTNPEFRHLASTNLLLYEAAMWACENNIPILHLGGGMAENDSLFGFKKQFNKYGQLPYAVGKSVFDVNGYKELLNIRANAECGFASNNNFLIQYRK